MGGGSAPIPGQALGTIAFPQPTACGSPCHALFSQDDVSGLTANAVSVDDDGGYEISTAGAGIALALGSGGISAAPGATLNAATPDVSWAIPLTLTADSDLVGHRRLGIDPLRRATWCSTPRSRQPGQTLAVRFANQGYLNVRAGLEAGSFTATGANTADTGLKAAQNGAFCPTVLNSSPAAPVSLTDVLLADEPPPDRPAPSPTRSGL